MLPPTTHDFILIRLLALTALLAAAARGGESLRNEFGSVRPDALAAKLAGLPPAAEEIPAGRLVRAVQAVPEIRGLRVESWLTSSNATPQDGSSLALAELSFRLRAADEDPNYGLLSYRDDQWYGSTYWTGPDWTRVGRNWHHPGEQTPSVRRFVSPADGRITITGRIFKLHQDGDGVRAIIFHGDRERWRAEIDGRDGTGIEPNVELTVHRGDVLRFVVHKRGHIFCDTTHWDPSITFADGTRCQASDSFGATQGAGGWFYEQFHGDTSLAAPIAAYGFSDDLVQREVGPPGDEPAEVVGQGDLPCLILADHRTQSGVLLVLDSAATAASVRWCVSRDGQLRLTVNASRSTVGQPADREALPSLVLAAFDGPWTAALPLLVRIADASSAPLRLPCFAAQVQDAYQRVVAGLGAAPDLDFLLLAQTEWRLDDAIDENVESYARAVEDQVRRTRALLAEFAADPGDSKWTAFSQELDRLAASDPGGGSDLRAWRRKHLRTRLLKWRAVFGNPLLEFQELLFCKRKPPSYSHLVGQYYGWRQRPGGGLFVLEAPGRSLRCREIVGGQLAPGSILEPRLSYDGRRIVFAYVACPAQPPDPLQLPPNEAGPDEAYFHIYAVGSDGTGLRQLTHGTYDDLMPVYLPDGGIAFCSTRRRSYSRCFGPQFSRRWDSYTLHRMDGDGANLRSLSANDVNEWFPAVSHRGEMLFARWDYIDRDAVTHQNLWSMRPDGTNPVAVWGNATPQPHCTFQAKSIPGSNKIAFIASAHHALTAGPLCLVDPSIDANSEAAITRITPGPFPEAESSDIPEYYDAPWPLSERYFLVAYSRDRLRFEGEHPRDPNPDNALGIYLVDAAGNRELIYRDPAISATTPIPFQPQRMPPVLPSLLPAETEAAGEMVVTDVYQGLGEIPRGSIRALRVVQIFPKTTPLANTPRIGIAGEENARAILGTVPVEPDGSARFLVPAHRPLLFQALDENGSAYQTMRSTTQVQPGERISCIGCHEHRRSTSPTRLQLPLAVRRAASVLEPGELGGRPFSYLEVVQPVLDRHCVRCHGGEKTEAGIDLTGTPHEGFSRSYWSLCGDVDGKPRTTARAGSPLTLVPRFPQRNQLQLTAPGGAIGSRGSGLLKLLRETHEDVSLSDDEYRRLAAWIDLNAVFFGAYQPEELARQLRREPVGMPAIQ